MLEATDRSESPALDAAELLHGGNPLGPSDTFVHRHIGPDANEIAQMLEVIECDSLNDLVRQTVPDSIRMRAPLHIGPPRGEFELLEELRAISKKNRVLRSYIGMGYYDTITPPVIQRNILENPGWYTQYTPYQAEISQGRLEALLNFQTMVADLTGLPIANASLLDEATAAAEAMAMCASATGRKTFLVAEDCHPQTISVVRTRAKSMGIEIVMFSASGATGAEAHGLQSVGFTPGSVAGVLLQYPTTDGRLVDYSALIEKAHESGALVVMAADLLALTLIKPPGEWGVDIAVGSAQRFGVPLGYGGPHAAFMATREEYVRKMPGRLIGVSHDVHGNVAYRMAIQTREQHIKRDRATSNICTAQVLLAIMAGMYAVYHGPEGLKRIARRVHGLTQALAAHLTHMGWEVGHEPFFDTICVRFRGGNAHNIAREIVGDAQARGINLRLLSDAVGLSLDETTTPADIAQLVTVFREGAVGGMRATADVHQTTADEIMARTDEIDDAFPAPFARASDFLTHPVFNTHHSETELLRYMQRLQSRDLSLAHSMIPLGSCTMKLNGTSEMLPVTWPEFGRMHPFAPADQAIGYSELFMSLEAWLSEITGFAAVSLQPNAGSQGEYAGLLAIRAYHESRGDMNRDVCLIPVSAHGTNPASAVIAGFRVVAVGCDRHGNIDLDDLKAKAVQHADRLGALMVTYPSTHGVFEPHIREVCDVIHEHGGQVYMDGANLNAQLGLCRPAEIGADVCHLNLHKTFCIPHGGGGPGMGPIGVAEHLIPFLPGYPLTSHQPTSRDLKGAETKQPLANASGSFAAVGPVSAAPWGSASILPISWMYIGLMGGPGLKLATEVAILNANYMAKMLESHYDVLYSGVTGRVAHEFILDCRRFEKSADVRVEDIAKRLMDYGFHAPTMSFPVPGTLMIEPTESETKGELDRFCEALIAIREEIRAIEEGRADRRDNVLKNAPHTVGALLTDEWNHGYTREQAAYPLEWVREHKFWPHVGRVDQAYGDRNLFCTCPAVEVE